MVRLSDNLNVLAEVKPRTSGGAGGEDANGAAGEEKNSAKPSRGKIH